MVTETSAAVMWMTDGLLGLMSVKWCRLVETLFVTGDELTVMWWSLLIDRRSAGSDVCQVVSSC